MGNCLGIGHNYARVGNSYEFDIESLQNSIDIKTRTLETSLKHLEIKYNGVISRNRDEIKMLERNLKELEDNVKSMGTDTEFRLSNLELRIEDNKTKTISMKQKFRDLGNMINNMSSSGDSCDSNLIPTEFAEESSEYTDSAPQRPNTPEIPSEISAFEQFKN